MFKYRNIFLGLGSNLGDRYHNIQFGISKLRLNPHIGVQKVSWIYETAPLYNLDQPSFLNCGVEIRSDLAAEELLQHCLAIEESCGRTRNGEKNQPRILDIDILFFGNYVINSPNLKIPHPRYFEREFVLLPMNDLASDFVCPDTKLTVKQMLQQCPHQTHISKYQPVSVTDMEIS